MHAQRNGDIKSDYFLSAEATKLYEQILAIEGKNKIYLQFTVYLNIISTILFSCIHRLVCTINNLFKTRVLII